MARWLMLPALLLLAVPFVTLLGITPWRHFRLAWGDDGAIAVSVGLGLVAILLVVALGLPTALWLSRAQGRRRWLVELLVTIPLLTPPLAMGIVLVSSYGPYSPLGSLLSRAGVALVNNPAAFVVAQVYGALPYFITSARSAFAGIPLTVDEAGRILGATAWQRLIHLTLPLAAPGLAAAVAIAWVRAVGEFGIVMIFAYFPQGIPVKLYVNLQNDGVDAVYALVWLLLAIALPLPLLCFGWAAKKNAHGDA
ncbi:ABC transporter permease subunit [Musicola paradisiaca]|uniref:Binding-protein-dependent transport systems inner membrane component n=1 Tax=Musicola paradisiaca (strain Ech703) TaxID=579405 RepID=C6CA44_MUSP7|nr:ABC transporter permease subunit [Musicola paradisiaca]ACS84519.1 binding-protein-dependent transport systems inner membrane component [Musicola paradisiaca Ech703]